MPRLRRVAVWKIGIWQHANGSNFPRQPEIVVGLAGYKQRSVDKSVTGSTAAGDGAGSKRPSGTPSSSSTITVRSAS